MRKILLLTLVFAISLAANAQQKSGAQQFFDKLKKHCGNAYEGKVTAGAGNDAFSTNRLVMHVRSCEDNRIRIPFFVGDDKSRTWVLTLENDAILLKHDHRHEDGSEDKVTQYGGWSTNSGADSIQMFPADRFTANLIPYAAFNVWWITVNDTSFTYNLRRIGSDRLFTVTFDLTKKVEVPSAPWGWKE